MVCVDECGANLAMTPRFARAPQGQRAVGQAPFVRGQNNTLIGALSIHGITAALTLGGAADAGVFIFFVREMLAPTLRPGQIVVLDNARIHQDSEVLEILESRGCYLLPLPAYSPDFCPLRMPGASSRSSCGVPKRAPKRPWMPLSRRLSKPLRHKTQWAGFSIVVTSCSINLFENRYKHNDSVGAFGQNFLYHRSQISAA